MKPTVLIEEESVRLLALHPGISEQHTKKGKLYNKLIGAGIAPANCISGNAFIAHDAKLGHRVSIAWSKSIVGNNTIINTF